ncbi:L-rhamnose mutarotase [Paenibacillus germinis]|uniref:L-rhamnose mutarotase n=1 Tax=Paenibacillus germinis TaxID=2654979 RepID=UPI001FECD2AF|nr:L-rhamnose mutarotase [Paenibacillus germinis]
MPPVNRYGSVIKVKPEKLEEYKTLHANVWSDVLNMIHACNIRNYSTLQHKNGGKFVIPAKSRWSRGLKANGGLQWRKFFILIEGYVK